MAAATEVLRFHRRDKIYDLKVIDVPQAWTGLHERAVLLISKTPLRLLETEELQALVAHEIGHEYVWGEYDRANVTGDRSRLRELEAACDDVAVRTLWAINVAPERLVRATTAVQISA